MWLASLTRDKVDVSILCMNLRLGEWIWGVFCTHFAKLSQSSDSEDLPWHSARGLQRFVPMVLFQMTARSATYQLIISVRGGEKLLPGVSAYSSYISRQHGLDYSITEHPKEEA